MMLNRVLYLLALLISGYYAQDTTTISIADWNGDPLICTVNPSAPTTSDKPFPQFPKQAEFTLEAVTIRHVDNATLPSQLTLFQYLYDFDANKLIMIRNNNGFIDVEYSYYENLKKSVYIRNEFCLVVEIEKDNPIDGTSAIRSSNGTWHIRPLNEFLLFSSNDPRQEQIRPRYLGESVVRGIPVDQWETCIINKTSLRTIKRTWSFARRGFVTPVGPVGDFAHPIQALINASILYPNGSQFQEFDEVFDVYAYRPGIVESAEQLVPPKGVFCNSGVGQQLVSLRDAGISWPERFTVRVEASSSRSADIQKFHLRYDRGRERNTKRIRYDYLPRNGGDYVSVIHDYGTNLTYNIDRRVGTCIIKRGVDFPDVSPTRDPVSFFIKHENELISSRDRLWEYNGLRTCRGNGIKCATLTTAINNFPPIVEVDTGMPTGETWDSTNAEYAWSVRSPYSRPPPDMQKGFDYPVYLFLRFVQSRDPSSPPAFNSRTEDIEYEFYEMSYETEASDFDTSICYRSRDFEYLHLGFTLKIDTANAIDGNHLDRRFLQREVHATLADRMDIKYSRISDLNVFHESASNEVTVLFTLLGPTPEPESPTGVSNTETTAAISRDTLQSSINGGKFQFSMKLSNDMTTDVVFTGVSGSLKSSKQIMSSHAAGKKSYNEYYTSGAQAGAVIGGIIVGLLIGVILAAVFRIWRKEPMPDIKALPTSFSNPLRPRDTPNNQKISFYNKKSAAEEKPTTDA
ncbi:unnamed protein product [Rotaria socialis]|uniref:Uncharacterized protein n=1 Tax=Rotaria socialis TaxID=392032 RepID=A0A820Y5X3_9BILA|nr:unnamed protein product [Rotaria socialis]CAF4542630.1 unnamed protein product [Rotaria socialis]